MRDLGKVVEVEAEVIRSCTGLGSPVLDHLEMIRLGRRSGLGDGRTRVADEPLDDLVADGMQRPVLTRRRDDRAPAAAGPRLRDRNLGEGPVQFTGFLCRADDVECEVLQRPEPDAGPLGQPAVLAIVAIVDGFRLPGEPIAMEGPVDDGRDPPAGDRVLSKLEQSRGHPSTRAR